MTEVDFAPVEAPFGGQSLAAAYEKLLPELEALEPSELIIVNLDVMAAVNTAAGVIPEVNRSRERITSDLPSFELKRLDQLPEYAMALAYAHTAHLATTQPQSHLRPMYEEALALRDLLESDVTTLAKRGLLSAESLQKLKGPNGFKNVQTDLQILVHVFRANWVGVAGKCAMTEAELARAEKLVSWLIQTVGLREQGPAEIAKSANLRVRAFTAFSRAYSDVRRAIAYVRWNEGDVDEIIPSLYQGRGGRKKETAAPTGDVLVGAGVVTEGVGGAVVSYGAAAAQVASSPGAALGNGAASNGVSAGGPFVDAGALATFHGGTHLRVITPGSSALNQTIGRLSPRWFVVRNAHVPEAGDVLLNPRHTMSILRGPLTRLELKRAREGRGRI